MSELNYVGKPAQRVDALDKVMGKTRYLADFDLPGMLYARALRSNLPHARIVKLDTSPALQVPGVKAVITEADFHEHGYFGFPVSDQTILAYQKVRYVGEALAAVAAETPQAAQAGVDAIILELEALPGLFEPTEALEPDAPQVGPDREDGIHPNDLGTQIVRKEDVDQTLAQSAHTLERTYRVPQQEHAYIETEGTLAIPDPDGGVAVYISCQSPFIPQGILISALNLDPTQVRVIIPPVGGSFGGKDDLNYQTAGQTAKLALLSGFPVRMTFSREESLIASYKRDGMHMEISLGADEHGHLQACKAESILDSGAFACQSIFTAMRAANHSMGPYRYDACKVDVTTVYTNNGYAGAFRGFGNTEATFAVEQAIDELAENVKMDPIDFRLKNALRVGDELPHGQLLTESVGLVECLETVRNASDWDRKRAAYADQSGQEIVRGIGVAALFHGASLGAEGLDCASSTIEVLPDYSLILTSGLTDYGTGSRTVYTLIAAEELSVNPGRIKMHLPDTNSAIDSGPTVASRATILGGNAIRVASQRIGTLLDSAAANLLGCEVDQLVRLEEQFIGPSEEPVDWETVVDHAWSMGLILSSQSKWTAPTIEWDHHAGRGDPYIGYHFGAQIAEVEVDMRTGKTDVIGFWAAHDAGKIIFPQGAYGQMYGGIAQGIGYALLEDVGYRDGYPQNTNFDSYLIPTAMDVPDIEGFFVETHFSPGPYGGKNIAEPALVPTAPAVCNAIANASGRRTYLRPASLEMVLLGEPLHPKGSPDACRIGLNMA
jgi:CO/xanthine dehydrogenase Mo-binding subunit